MKYYRLIFIAPLFLILFGINLEDSRGEEKSFDDLVRKGGLWFNRTSGELFSGRLTGEILRYTRGCKGCKRYDGPMLDGKPNGVWEYFHDNDQVYQRKSFKNGKLDGSFISFYYDGTICQRGAYKNGKKVGNWERFDKGGLAWIDGDRSPECDMCLCKN